MKNNRVILIVVLLVAALGSSESQFAQDAPTRAEKSNSQLLALGFLRTINMAEAGDFAQYNSYESWQTLLAHEPQYLNAWLANYYPENSGVHFGDPPKILPGLSLRLNVHTDGHGYDVLLEDLSDKNGYAVVSDERGVIRECKFLH